MIKRLTTRLLLGLSLVLPVTAFSQQFSIVVIPDTQWYAELHPEVLESQIDWIVANQVAENIIYVAHLGDLKDDLSCDNKTITAGTGGSRTEWQIVDQAFQDLDGAGIAYGVVPGNHDFDQMPDLECPDFVAERPLTTFNSLFGPTRFAGDPWYGDPGVPTDGNRVMSSNEDNFTLFDSDGVKFIAINLAYKEAPDAGPAEPELDWADDLLKDYPDRLGIVTSHYFMDQNPGNNLGPYGQQVYDWLANNPNFFMMLSAHEFGEAWQVGTSLRTGMQPVQVLLQDYQQIDYPGDGDAGTPCEAPNVAGIDFTNLGGSPCGDRDSGFMRIMRFDTTTGMVNVETFIPPEPVIKNRLLTVTSTYFPADGTGMGPGTASNISFSYLGYAANPTFDIFECDTTTGGTCTTAIGSIELPSGAGSQTDGTGITLVYNNGVAYDAGDIQNVDWVIDAVTGELTTFVMQANSDPGCLAGITPPPCSQTTQRWNLISPGLMGTSPSAGSCDIDPGTGLPFCISSISIGPAELFDPQ